MDVTITLTKANIKKGWQDNACPVHRAVARAFKCTPQDVIASSEGVRVYKNHILTPLRTSEYDYQYLIEVMHQADRQLYHTAYGNNPAPQLQPARKIVVHVDN